MISSKILKVIRTSLGFYNSLGWDISLLTDNAILSTWFTFHAPHGLNHVPICYSPHGFHGILLMLDIISPYSILHIVGSAFSSCLASFLHMLFST